MVTRNKTTRTSRSGKFMGGYAGILHSLPEREAEIGNGGEPGSVVTRKVSRIMTADWGPPEHGGCRARHGTGAARWMITRLESTPRRSGHGVSMTTARFPTMRARLCSSTVGRSRCRYAIRRPSSKSLFTANGWPAAWRNGIYPYHHFHSTAHEVLGVFSGTATALFGGESGIELTVSAGDVVVVPAGVGHKALEASTDLGIVGAYPAGSRPDLCRGAPGERPGCLDAIARVGKPDRDPLYGERGPLQRHWFRPTPPPST